MTKDKKIKKWVKFKRTKREIELGYQLCPICKRETVEQLQDGENTYQERCSNGCYLYDFEKMERIR